MARRSDHTPQELRTLLVEQGHALISESGFAKFSAREAARRAGYSVGTIYNVFGSLDGYLLAINSRTFHLWADWLEQALAGVAADGTARPRALVHAYFDFAARHPNAWTAIYDHRHDPARQVPAEDSAARARLTGIVDREVVAWLGGTGEDEDTRRLVRSLIATVHGHCALWLTGSYAAMQEADPAGQAVARVLEILEAQRK